LAVVAHFKPEIFNVLARTMPVMHALKVSAHYMLLCLLPRLPCAAADFADMTDEI
jgi:hypothetical protein